MSLEQTDPEAGSNSNITNNNKVQSTSPLLNTLPTSFPSIYLFSNTLQTFETETETHDQLVNVCQRFPPNPTLINTYHLLINNTEFFRPRLMGIAKSIESELSSSSQSTISNIILRSYATPSQLFTQLCQKQLTTDTDPHYEFNVTQIIQLIPKIYPNIDFDFFDQIVSAIELILLKRSTSSQMDKNVTLELFKTYLTLDEKLFQHLMSVKVQKIIPNFTSMGYKAKIGDHVDTTIIDTIFQHYDQPKLLRLNLFKHHRVKMEQLEQLTSSMYPIHTESIKAVIDQAKKHLLFQFQTGSKPQFMTDLQKFCKHQAQYLEDSIFPHIYSIAAQLGFLECVSKHHTILQTILDPTQDSLNRSLFYVRYQLSTELQVIDQSLPQQVMDFSLVRLIKHQHSGSLGRGNGLQQGHIAPKNISLLFQHFVPVYLTILHAMDQHVQKHSPTSSINQPNHNNDNQNVHIPVLLQRVHKLFQDESKKKSISDTIINLPSQQGFDVGKLSCGLDALLTVQKQCYELFSRPLVPNESATTTISDPNNTILPNVIALSDKAGDGKSEILKAAIISGLSYGKKVLVTRNGGTLLQYMIIDPDLNVATQYGSMKHDSIFNYLTILEELIHQVVREHGDDIVFVTDPAECSTPTAVIDDKDKPHHLSKLWNDTVSKLGTLYPKSLFFSAHSSVKATVRTIQSQGKECSPLDHFSSEIIYYYLTFLGLNTSFDSIEASYRGLIQNITNPLDKSKVIDLFATLNTITKDPSNPHKVDSSTKAIQQLALQDNHIVIQNHLQLLQSGFIREYTIPTLRNVFFFIDAYYNDINSVHTIDTSKLSLSSTKDDMSSIISSSSVDPTTKLRSCYYFTSIVHSYDPYVDNSYTHRPQKAQRGLSTSEVASLIPLGDLQLEMLFYQESIQNNSTLHYPKIQF